jgi:hypothetical protein
MHQPTTSSSPRRENSRTEGETITKKAKKKLKDENFRWQNKTLGKLDNDIITFGADVYIQVRRKGKIRIYTSSLDDCTWPLR